MFIATLYSIVPVERVIFMRDLRATIGSHSAPPTATGKSKTTREVDEIAARTQCKSLSILRARAAARFWVRALRR